MVNVYAGKRCKRQLFLVEFEYFDYDDELVVEQIYAIAENPEEAMEMSSVEYIRGSLKLQKTRNYFELTDENRRIAREDISKVEKLRSTLVGEGLTWTKAALERDNASRQGNSLVKLVSSQDTPKKVEEKE